MRTLVEGLRPRSRSWPLGVRLDQRREGACTGFAAAHDLAAVPAPARDVTDELAREIYYEARRRDEWPGENYDGSSVLGAAKAIVAMGFAGEYRWAGEGGASASAIDDVVLALGHVGGVVFGTDVTDSWYEPEPGAVVTANGPVIGGHSYFVRGVILSRDGQRRLLGRGVQLRGEPLLRITNSWGPGWGKSGECFMWASDAERLLTGLAYPGEARVTVTAFRRTV